MIGFVPSAQHTENAEIDEAKMEAKSRSSKFFDNPKIHIKIKRISHRAIKKVHKDPPKS